MTDLLPLLVGLPILAAGVTAVLPSAAARRGVLLTLSAAVLGYALWLLSATLDGSVLVEQVSGWPPGISIPFAADTLSALMVAVAALLVLVGAAYAAAAGDDRDRWFVPLVLVMSAGVYGAFVTADLFNLFVMIEVALVPSYALLVRSGRGPAVSAGRIYLTVNLLISTVLLVGVGLTYGVTGTVNLGELAGIARQSDAAAAAAGVVLVALAGKAALVPMHGWLPRTYPFASVAVTALFSGLLTKIGVYGLFRVYGVVFDGDPRLERVLLVVLIASMVIGVIGALGSPTMRSILAFHMISQTGYILLGLGFFGVLGVAAGIFYLIHHVIVKAALFMAAGAVEHGRGTGTVDRLGGVARREPLLAAVFVVAALSLSGLPPFSGFIAKFALIRAAVIDGAYIAAAAAVVVSLFTLLSMMKIWNGVFWGRDPGETVTGTAAGATATADTGEPIDVAATTVTTVRAPTRIPTALVVPGAVLATLTVAIGLGGEALLTAATTAAEGLVDTTTYVEAVIGR